MQIRDDGWCGAQEDHAGSERECPNPIGRQDRHSPDGALTGTRAIVTERDRVRELITLSDECRKVLKIAGVGRATENDLCDARIPDGSAEGLVDPGFHS